MERDPWCGDVRAFLARPGSGGVEMLRDALATLPEARNWAVFLNYQLLRMGGRIDAVVVTPGAVLVFRIPGATAGSNAAHQTAIEDAALDLADFHAGCHRMPVIPILVVSSSLSRHGARPLPLSGALPVIETMPLLLPGLLRDIAIGFPAVPRAASPSEWG
jgi:hypothetical protein